MLLYVLLFLYTSLCMHIVIMYLYTCKAVYVCMFATVHLVGCTFALDCMVIYSIHSAVSSCNHLQFWWRTASALRPSMVPPKDLPVVQE